VFSIKNKTVGRPARKERSNQYSSKERQETSADGKKKKLVLSPPEEKRMRIEDRRTGSATPARLREVDFQGTKPKKGQEEKRSSRGKEKVKKKKETTATS